jgi:RNA polymerase sigma-70 factor (ECF subfamily)
MSRAPIDRPADRRTSEAMTDRPPSDNEASIRGERFMRLLMPAYKRLEDFAFAMARDREEARDLVAQTVLVAFESFDRLRDDQAFVAYLFTIASREFQRGRRRSRWFGPFSQPGAERIEYRGTAPDVSVDVDLLYTALARLPHREREAVVLFEISGFSMKEVRAIQGGSLSGVKVRIFRARRRLAVLLGAREAAGQTAGQTAPRRDSGGETRDPAADDAGRHEYAISFEANLKG